ncbi:hypothetical protein CHU93_16815 [Sandarakinorhabdus cyanobacteriorum]|uniref:Cyclic nucleotide-binding domain-containing protein n=1 Tax=Sandarakinorhabdus cyanobacteriorum TaxID=1981098 RepID=A0A255Y593_9SPHN|nr:hypothetical protein CHU93_16815 [Sandarakinorhabdus cyanobacteriorum]
MPMATRRPNWPFIAQYQLPRCGLAHSLLVRFRTIGHGCPVDWGLRVTDSAAAGYMSGLDSESVLPPDLAAAFAAGATQIHARKGQLLIVQGSDADEVYLIRSGRVRVSVYAANGRETFLRDMGPGRLLGELAAISGQPRSAMVAAIEPTVLASIKAEAFRQFLHDVPGAGFWLAQQLTMRVQQLTEKSLELASLPVAARLVSELLRLTSTDGASAEPAVDPVGADVCTIAAFPTHAELATRIGTHREAVTRELRQLAREGLAVQSGRRLTIPSRLRLRALLEQLSR